MPGALYAYRELKRLAPAKLLWIGGGKPDAQHSLRIARAIRDNGLREEDVIWTGVLPHPDVSRLLSACDLMLLPFVDGLSTRRTSAAAALQHGLPVLTTRGQAPEPLFVHGENVYFVPVGDKQALANGIVELVETTELRTRLAKGAQALYSAHFSWGAIAQQVVRLADATPIQ
jgi:glycosyltransferase involved in cell wall biosynthesis